MSVTVTCKAVLFYKTVENKLYGNLRNRSVVQPNAGSSGGRKRTPCSNSKFRATHVMTRWKAAPRFARHDNQNGFGSPLCGARSEIQGALLYEARLKGFQNWNLNSTEMVREPSADCT